jgi:DNA-binding NarL/FixJ family response regulator
MPRGHRIFTFALARLLLQDFNSRMTVEIAQGAGPGQAPRRLRVLLADDHEMFRMAMRVALTPLGPDTEWLEAGSAEATTALLERCGAVDIALLDLHMPQADGLPWIARLRERFPDAPLVVVSADERGADIKALIDLGVAGFIPKSDSAAVILQAVRLVLSGGTYVPLRLLALSNARLGAVASGLDGSGSGNGADAAVPGLTPRQDEVLRLLAQGYPNKLIARDLGLSEGTVKVHLLAIYRVLNARNRTAAVIAAQKWLQAAQARPR